MTAYLGYRRKGRKRLHQHLFRVRGSRPNPEGGCDTWETCACGADKHETLPALLGAQFMRYAHSPYWMPPGKR